MQFSPGERVPITFNLWNWLKQGLIYLTSDTTQLEPKISRHLDREGTVWWEVYDPYTGKIRWFDSENELRIWLDRF